MHCKKPVSQQRATKYNFSGSLYIFVFNVMDKLLLRNALFGKGGFGQTDSFHLRHVTKLQDGNYRIGRSIGPIH